MTVPTHPDSRPRSLDGFLRTGYLIHDVSRLRRAYYDQRSRHLGITRAQWWVLFNLSRIRDAPIKQHELAQMLEMGTAAIGELLTRLEKSRFVSRRVVPGDRRCKVVTIAERGHDVLEHMRQVAMDSHNSIMEGISAEQQRVLDEVLTRMKQNLLTGIAASTGPVIDSLERPEPAAAGAVLEPQVEA